MQATDITNIDKNKRDLKFDPLNFKEVIYNTAPGWKIDYATGNAENITK